MKRLTKRRLVGATAVIVVSALAVAADKVAAASLAATAWISGWALAGIVLVLAAYNLRKRLTFLPVLGSSSTWLQVHVYLGLFGITGFLVHVGYALPSGPLEIALAVLFVLVTTSGIAGLVLSRVLARRLDDRGQHVLYERIPRLRRRLADEADALVVACAGRNPHTVIAEFHAEKLFSFFVRPRNFWAHLLRSTRPRRDLLAGLDALERFLNADEKQTARRLGHYVRLKDDLDFHYALQSVLKFWLFFHIPLTYVLIAVMVVHGLVAQAHIGV